MPIIEITNHNQGSINNQTLNQKSGKIKIKIERIPTIIIKDINHNQRFIRDLEPLDILFHPLNFLNEYIGGCFLTGNFLIKLPHLGHFMK